MKVVGQAVKQEATGIRLAGKKVRVAMEGFCSDVLLSFERLDAVSRRGNNLNHHLSRTCVGLAVALLLAGPVTAETNGLSFDMSAQSLDSALTAYGLRVGKPIIFDPSTVRNKRSGPVRGAFSDEQALRVLLNGTGLHARPAGRGYVIAIASTEEVQDRPLRGPNEASVAPPDPIPSPPGDIVVTAQKRSQSINSVGMSVAAFKGDDLSKRGITRTADLDKVVPGFTFAESPTLTPVYSLRGIGFYDSSLASSPAVSVYVDQVPVPFPIMTEGAALDLERVEVLKGPQGTLFGQNSTGGAINYIAAKPTTHFEAGGDLSYERFGRLDASGFVSGPITDTLTARLALGVIQGGAWQESTTRNDELGSDRQTTGRLLLDWKPTDRLKVEVNLNGFVDRSDSQAPQLIGLDLTNPSIASPALLTAPIVGSNDRKADWTPTAPNRMNEKYGQASARIDYKLTNTLTVTSLSSFSYINLRNYLDGDGTAVASIDTLNFGKISALNQELRLAGTTPKLDWIIGANFERDKVDDTDIYDIRDSTIGLPLLDVPGFEDVPRLIYGVGTTKQKIHNYAAFANAEYHVTRNLSLQAGLRYTDSKRQGTNCGTDVSPGNEEGKLFYALQQLYGVANPILVPLGQCLEFGADDVTPIVQPYQNHLHENNLSWRAGINYKMDNGILTYANLSRGWKAGAIPTLSPSLASEYVPAVQERVDAAEVGVKAPLYGHALQLNAAAFYYKYHNKQVRGTVDDPVFGLLEKLINVPHSRIWGLEAAIVAKPYRGVSLSGGMTYVNSKISGSFDGINKGLESADFAGSTLPFTPRYQGDADAQYEWALSGSLTAFVGASLTYHSKSNATFAVAAAPATAFRIKGYSLLDLRAGFGSSDERWRLSVFGRNVTNTYYWSTVFQGSDTLIRYAGRPATFGVSLSVRMK